VARAIKLAATSGFLFLLWKAIQFKRDDGSFQDLLHTYKQIAGMATVLGLDRAKKAILRAIQ
jgi:hypothetical protein